MHNPDVAPPQTSATPILAGLDNRSRTVLALSLGAGLVYPFVAPALSPATAVIAKGSGVALLALAAALKGTNQRWWLVAIMAAGAAGDILLEIDGLFLQGLAPLPSAISLR